MSLQTIDSETELLTALSPERELVVGFFGEFSEASRRGRPAFETFASQEGARPVYLVDVGKVRGLHVRFGVSAVPTVIRVKGETVLQKLEGVQTTEAYAQSLSGAGGATPATGTDKRAHRVRVYVTDTCPWCTRVKSYLRQNHVSYSEVNVSRDESAAREMVRRSGQQGVPQVDIDGRMIVGFDKARIDALLGLGHG